MLVGRLPKCDVVIQDGSVSSQHARLQLLDGVLRVVDMGSTNGTRVNYTLLTKPAVLLDGDTLEFGNVCFNVDGPELRKEEKSGPPSSLLTDWKNVEASQRIDATMSISLPEEFEKVEAPPAAAPEEQTAPSAVSSGEAPAESSEPLLAVLLMLLAAGALLLAELWNWTP